jgi:outer membrane protein OmpA-like peptidoglycan-associated protein
MYRVIVVLLFASVLQQFCMGVPGAEAGGTAASTLPGERLQISTARESALALELYFRPGSCRLSRNNLANLRRAMKTLQELVSRSKEATLLISGYADRQGSPEYGLGLAAVRCERVRQYLIARGIPDSKLRPVSRGVEPDMLSPLLDESTGNRRRHGDRVQITVATAVH